MSMQEDDIIRLLTTALLGLVMSIQGRIVDRNMYIFKEDLDRAKKALEEAYDYLEKA